MNNNLNWSGNRVVGNAGTEPNKSSRKTPMQPYPEPMPSGYDAMPDYQQGVSPSTYQQDSSGSPYPPAGVPMQDIQSTDGTQTRNDAYAPNAFYNVPGPPSVMDPGYIPGYLKTQIGKSVRAEFVFTNLYLDKTGVLLDVGYNYFVLEDNATKAHIMCDLYSVRFLTSI